MRLLRRWGERLLGEGYGIKRCPGGSMIMVSLATWARLRVSGVSGVFDTLNSNASLGVTMDRARPLWICFFVNVVHIVFPY